MADISELLAETNILLRDAISNLDEPDKQKFKNKYNDLLKRSRDALDHGDATFKIMRPMNDEDE